MPSPFLSPVVFYQVVLGQLKLKKSRQTIYKKAISAALLVVVIFGYLSVQSSPPSVSVISPIC
jgi:hypothetical protein